MKSLVSLLTLLLFILPASGEQYKGGIDAQDYQLQSALQTVSPLLPEADTSADDDSERVRVSKQNVSFRPALHAVNASILPVQSHATATHPIRAPPFS